jgi:hypothetical protein
MEILIQENVYHYMVHNPSRALMEDPTTKCAQGQQKAMTIINLVVKDKIFLCISNINDLTKAWKKF